MAKSRPAWWRYQAEVASFLGELGLRTTLDVHLNGVRTSHDVDVEATFQRAGVEVRWIVECKLWQSGVSKLHVLALREIVSDLGADRGIIMAERGYQKGALEAASSSNVLLSSLAALRTSADEEICALEMRRIRGRIDVCSDLYWSLSKSDRIEAGLRPDVGATGYSSVQVIESVRSVVDAATWGQFPVRADTVASFINPVLTFEASTMRELIELVEPVVADLERRLAAATTR